MGAYIAHEHKPASLSADVYNAVTGQVVAIATPTECTGAELKRRAHDFFRSKGKLRLVRRTDSTSDIVSRRQLRHCIYDPYRRCLTDSKTGDIHFLSYGYRLQYEPICVRKRD